MFSRESNSTVDVPPGETVGRRRARSGLASALACRSLAGALGGLKGRHEKH